jgi:hypothetical protein
MATTTNYSWTTPDDTDLVKDGAAAIRTLGSSADTTVKDLNPGTTAGDIDYYTSSTAKARVAIGTAGQVLKVNGGGTAPEWATTADQTPLTTKGDLFTFDTADARLGVGANGTVLTADSAEATGLKWVVDPVADVITTAGDLIYGTAADTVNRLGIGTAGQLLAVNSGATAPEWVAAPSSGSMTSIASGTLSGSSVTISSIPATYKDLRLIVRNFLPSTDGETLNGRVNGQTGNSYFRTGAYSTTVSSIENFFYITEQGSDNTVSGGFTVFDFFDYGDANHLKLLSGIFLTINSSNTANRMLGGVRGIFNSNNAINSITMLVSAGTMGGTYILYGVN